MNNECAQSSDYSSTPALEAKHITKHFRGISVLDDVSLVLNKGSVVCVIGPSGAGKSTLLRCLSLQHSIDAGEIAAFGQTIVRARSSGREMGLNSGSRSSLGICYYMQPEEYRRRVGIVFQEFNLWFDRTVLENVAIGPHLSKRLPRPEAQRIALSLLDRFALKQYADRYPDHLSGGQRQRVAIARALAMSPDILLLDEITSALDPELVSDVLLFIHELAATGLTMLIVTHHLAFARRVVSQIVMMAQGRIIEYGQPDAVLDSPAEARTREFIGKVLDAN